MESSCTQRWQAAVDSCVSYGGNIASIVSRQILDDLQTVFGSQVPELEATDLKIYILHNR